MHAEAKEAFQNWALYQYVINFYGEKSFSYGVATKAGGHEMQYYIKNSYCNVDIDCI